MTTSLSYGHRADFLLTLELAKIAPKTSTNQISSWFGLFSRQPEVNILGKAWKDAGKLSKHLKN